jgi:CBS domain containing-hemolysin-like protein
MDLTRLVAIALLVLLNAFFVASEFALVALRRSRIEEMAADGDALAAPLKVATDNLDQYIAGTQVGITLASLGLGWIGEPALAHLLEPALAGFPWKAVTAHAIAISIAFGALTFLHVVMGELIPKSIALQRTEPVARLIAVPMRWAVVLLRPFIWVLNGAGNAILRLMGLHAAQEVSMVHSVDELQILFRKSLEAGVLDEFERKMAHRALFFSEKTARDVMRSRVDMAAIDGDRPLDEIYDSAARSNHSRLPVYSGSPDNITGILLAKDIFAHMTRGGGLEEFRQLLRTPLFVPESMHLDKVLEEFRRKRTQIAVVIDEYGGTAGIVTLDDIVEEIFGEFEEEKETEIPALSRSREGHAVLRGDLRLDEVEELLGWELSDEHSDTLAGYIMSRLGRPAEEGDIVQTPGGSLRVDYVERLRIRRVTVLPGAGSRPADDGRGRSWEGA